MHDGELLCDYVENRSEAAFSRLVERHLNLVYATALRRTEGNVESAKDVTQRVFIRLARKAGSLLRHPILAGWLYRATCLEAAAWQRAERRRLYREQAAGLELDRPDADAATVDWGRLKPVIDDALLELNESDRLAILLRFFAGQRLTEIGEAFGLGENATRMRVERALEKLKMLLARRGITSTSGALATVLTANTVHAAPAGLAAGVAGAVVSAVAAPGGIAGAGVNFFLMTKFQLAAAGCLLALLAGSAMWEWQKTESLQRRLAVERQYGSELQSAAEESGKRGADGSNQTLSSSARATSQLSPTARRDSIQVMKALLDRGHAALFRRLRLPAAELDRLKELLAEREDRVSRAMRIAREVGLNDLTLAEQRQIRSLASGDSHEAIRALLGEADYRYFEDYDRTLLVRNLFSVYTDEMQVLGDPLTDRQVDRLVDLLQTALGPALDHLHDEGGLELPESSIASSAAFLSPRQTQQLERTREEWSARRSITALNRLAALQGKLELTEQSALDYPGSPVARD